jgi:hypothetical protein
VWVRVTSVPSPSLVKSTSTSVFALPLIASSLPSQLDV